MNLRLQITVPRYVIRIHTLRPEKSGTKYSVPRCYEPNNQVRVISRKYWLYNRRVTYIINSLIAKMRLSVHTAAMISGFQGKKVCVNTI